jgi:copper chaperone CopZ
MKNLKVATSILSMTLVLLMSTSCRSEVKKDNQSSLQTEDVNEIALVNINFGVRGNCGMCKKTIEKAVNTLEGVTNAVWVVDKKKINVSFDDTKTNEMAIHHAIAASGYDTEKVAANLEAYNSLPGCCQYDHNMVMNQ